MLLAILQGMDVKSLIPSGKFKFGKNALQKLVDDLAKIDLQLADPVKRGVMTRVFGESRQFKQMKADTRKALITKKCMLINTFVLPTTADELAAYVHLALSCVKVEKESAVSQAWKSKMELAMNRLRVLITTDKADHLADEFLFLSEKVSGQ